MKIGIELPTTFPTATAPFIREWGKLADAGPFSSLGIIDRLAYPNFDPLIILAAVATETQRIRLMTGVLVAPLHNAGILAKQAASLDALSNGRLSLGLAVGGREEDFRAAPASFSDRGKRFEQQLELMTRIWSGQPVDDEIGLIGPTPVQPGGPEVLIGAGSPSAMARVGRWGNGYIAAGLGPSQMAPSAATCFWTTKPIERPLRTSNELLHYNQPRQLMYGKETLTTGSLRMKRL